MNVVQSFNKLQAASDLDAAGGKGSVLARLYQHGFPVPDGFLILPGAFSGNELRPVAWAQVQEQLARLHRGASDVAFAVRSSATAEDTLHRSFAGEFDTVLDVESEQAIRKAIRVVRESRHSERVRAYAAATGAVSQIDMAIVVQRMVEPRFSGVLFTADPVTGSRAGLVGNYVRGRGDRLVSGEDTGETFRLHVPGGTYEGPDELARHARDLYRLARRLQRELGAAQDIEWAIGSSTGSEEKLYVLQSRPISTLVGYNPDTGDWNTSLTGDYLWSNVNFGEAVTAAMTPLSWTVLRQVLRDWAFLPGYPTVGSIAGRPYLNISVFATAFRAVGRSEKELIKSLEGTLYMRLPPKMRIPVIPLSRRQRLSVIPRLIQIIARQALGVRRFSDFAKTNPGLCQGLQEQIAAAQTVTELLELWHKAIDPHIRRSVWIVLGTATYSSDYAVALRKELVALVGPDDADAMMSAPDQSVEARSGADLLDSLAPLVNIARVSRGELDRKSYLTRYGHRGPHEFELSVPRPAEDPVWLEQQLALWEQSPVNVEALLEQRRRASDAAWERFRGKYAKKARSMQRRIKEARERARMRETARSEYVRDRWLVRAFALRAGQLTELGDDVFFLTLAELLDSLSGKPVAAGSVPARKETLREYQSLGACPPIIRGRFDPRRWAADPNRSSDVFDAHGAGNATAGEAPAEHADVVQGAAGSAGRVEGKVRCLGHPDAGNELRKGEVLVAAQTDIAWTPLFPRAAAIVTDVGAPLSHAAIVARELGIPAVVGCGDATMRLRTGDVVRVDGGRGTVEKLGRDHETIETCQGSEP